MKTLVSGLALTVLVSTPVASGTTEHAVIYQSMGVVEFVALQKLSDAALRGRFRLPESCNPSLSAVRGTTARVQVLITCEREGVTAQHPWTERMRSRGELP
jgi:hypothetical protein